MGFLVLRLQAKEGTKQVLPYVSLHCWQAWQVQLPLESQTSQTSSDIAFLVIVLLICEMGPCVPALRRLRPQGPLSRDPGQPPLTSTEAAGLAQSWSTRVFVVLCSGCPDKAPQSGGCKSQIKRGAGPVPSEASLLGVWMADLTRPWVFTWPSLCACLCPHLC